MDNEGGLRTLPYRAHYNNFNTIENCKLACFSHNYRYAGVQYAKECYCGNNAPKKVAPKETECNMDCSGDNINEKYKKWTGCDGGDSCCTPSNQCSLGEGDCDTDADCLPGLRCGKDNCKGDDFDSTDDCCIDPNPALKTTNEVSNKCGGGNRMNVYQNPGKSFSTLEILTHYGPCRKKEVPTLILYSVKATCLVHCLTLMCSNLSLLENHVP